jgi:hypothetical protein
MQDTNDLVQKENTFFLENISNVDIVIELNRAKDDVSSVSWDHDLQLPITFGYGISDNSCSKLPKAHLEKLPDSVDCFLELHCFNLALCFEV